VQAWNACPIFFVRYGYGHIVVLEGGIFAQLCEIPHKQPAAGKTKAQT